METPNNHKAIQVENLKTSLDDWKHVVVKIDSVVNGEDPIKRACGQILVSTCLFGINVGKVSKFFMGKVRR